MPACEKFVGKFLFILHTFREKSVDTWGVLKLRAGWLYWPEKTRKNSERGLWYVPTRQSNHRSSTRKAAFHKKYIVEKVLCYFVALRVLVAVTTLARNR